MKTVSMRLLSSFLSVALAATTSSTTSTTTSTTTTTTTTTTVTYNFQTDDSCDAVFEFWSDELNSCFYYQPTPKRWIDAFEECKSFGGSLPVPINDIQNNYVNQFATGTTETAPLTFLGIWTNTQEFTHAITGQNLTYSNWSHNDAGVPIWKGWLNPQGHFRPGIMMPDGEWRFLKYFNWAKYWSNYLCIRPVATSDSTSTTSSTSTTTTSSITSTTTTTTTSTSSTTTGAKTAVATVNSCNSETGDMVLNVSVTGVKQKPGESWNQTSDSSYSHVYSADQAEKDFDGDQLKLTVNVTSVENCEGIEVGGQVIYTNCEETTFVFTCFYDLSDQVLEDGYTVSGANITTTTAQASGTINYELIVAKGVNMGQKISFEIVPKTPNIVFASVKSCTVAQGSNKVDIVGYNDKNMCFLEQTGAGWENSPSSQTTINGYWRAFQWYGNGLTAVESQTLSCTIGLSKEQNTQPVEKCDL